MLVTYQDRQRMTPQDYAKYSQAKVRSVTDYLAAKANAITKGKR